MYCERCRREIDGSDVRRVISGLTETLECPRCDGVFMQHESRVVKPLLPELATAFYYPFRLVTLIASVVVVFLATGASFIPVVGGFIGAGIRFGWVFAILRASSDGNEDVEVDPTDISGSLVGWISPAIRFFLVCFVAFLPAGIGASALGDASSWIVFLLGALGLFYLPAGVIAAAEANAWYAPLNPVPAVMVISRIPGAYFIACGMLLVLFTISGVAIGLALQIEVPYVGTSLAGLFGYLPLVAAARMLGILVYEKREEL